MKKKTKTLLNPLFIRSLYTLFLMGFFYFANNTAKSQDLSGREFWFTFPITGALVNGEGPQFFILSDYCIDNGLLEFPALNYTMTFSVQPGQYTQIMLPKNIAGQVYNHTTPFKIEKKGIRIKTPFPVVVYAVTYEQASVDGEVVAPLQMLGTTYVGALRAEVLTGLMRSTIVATEDTTTVNIKYWRQNNGKDTTISVKLNLGETYQISTNRNVCSAEIGDVCFTVDATVVTSDKPVAVINSTDCGNTNPCGPCDNMMTMPLPVDKWDKNYTLAQGISRNPTAAGTCNAKSSGDWYQIMGPIGTPVKIMDRIGTRVDTIKKVPWNGTANFGYGYIWGEILPANAASVGNCDMVIEAEAPVQVVQYQKSYSADGNAATDPEAVLIYPTSMWKPSYLMGSLRTTTTTAGFITVVLNDVGSPLPSTTILRNGANIGAGGWTTIGTTTWKYKRMSVVPAVASDRFTSTGNYDFGIYSSSLGSAESFSFQGGLGPILTSQCPVCPIADFTVKKTFCINQPITFTDKSKDNDTTGLSRIIKWVWNYGDGSTDSTTTSTNPTHTFTNPGVYNIKLTVTNDAIPVCSQDYVVRVTVSGGPKINAGVDDTICIGSKVKLGGSPTVSGGLPPYVINWSPGTGLSSTSAANPNANPTITTEYRLTVTDSGNCVIKDTVLVTVLSKDSIYFDTQGTICNGDSVPFTAHIATPNSYSFTVVINDGTSDTTISGLKDGSVFYVHPTSTRTYKIVDFYRDDKKRGCFLYTNATYTVTVKSIPTASFGSGGSICQGGTFNLSVIIPSTGGPYNFTYSGPAGSVIKSSQSASPISIPVSPTTTSTYTLTNIEYSNAPKCSFNPGATVTVTVVTKSNPGIGDTINLCKSGSPVDLDTLLKGNPDSGTWSELDGSGILNGSIVNPALNPGITLGNYRYLYTVKGNLPCPDTTTRAMVTIVGPPSFTNVVDKGNCDAPLKNYFVTAKIVNGDNKSYTSPDGTITNSGGTFNFTSSASYPTKTSYTIRVDDANRCGPTTYTGYVNCGCKTNPGTMDSDPVAVCETDSATIPTPSDTLLLPGDTLVYVLHEGSGSTIISEKARSRYNKFALLPGMLAGQPYFVSAIAGPAASYGPDTTSDCYVVSPGTQVTWQKLPTANLSGSTSICNGTSTPLNLTFTGNAPFKAVVNAVHYNSTGGTYSASVSPTSTTTYKIDSIYDKYCALQFNSPTITVTVNNPPTVVQSSKTITCNSTATGYTFSFDLTGGDPSTYKELNQQGNFSGATFTTTNTINNGAMFSALVDDKNNCGPIQVDTTYTCPCITKLNSGISPTNSSACETSTITLNPASFTPDPDDSVRYVLHTNLMDPFKPAPLAVQRGTTFSKLPGMLNNTNYYVTAIAGNYLSSSSVEIDTLDRCFQSSNTVIIRFTPNPTATIDPDTAICAGQSFNPIVTASYSGTFQVNYTENTIQKSFPPFTGRTYTAPSQTPSSNTTYVLTSITDNNTGCSSILNDQAVVTINTAPTMTVAAQSPTYCEDDTVRLVFTFTGAPQYQFYINGVYQYANSNNWVYNQPNAPNGNLTYTITNFNDSKCIGVPPTAPVSVIKYANPTGSVISPDSICTGQPLDISFTLNGSGPFNIRHKTNGMESIANSVNSGYQESYNIGSYLSGINSFELTYILDQSTGCSNNFPNSTDYTKVNSLPSATFVTPANPICYQQSGSISLTLTGSAPYDVIIWDSIPTQIFDTLNGTVLNPASIEITPTVIGNKTYGVFSIVDATGCMGSGTNTVQVACLPAPTPIYDLSDTAACTPLTTTFNNYSVNPGNSNLECKWYIGYDSIMTCNDFTQTFTRPGVYPVILKVTDLNSGCSAQTDPSNIRVLQVYAYPEPEFTYSPEKPTFTNNQVQFFNEGSSNDYHIWYMDKLDTLFGVFNPVYTFPNDEERTYNIKLVTIGKGECVDSTENELTIHGETFSYIPNSFTPNGDNLNEVFKPVISGSAEELGLKSYELIIMNRWGNMLFQTNDINVGWNGTFEGNKVDIGVYIYKIRFRSRYNADAKEILGKVSVFR